MNYLITTTIHVPKLLADYARDASTHNHDFQIIVIGDKKTPAAAKTLCQNLPNTTYFGPDEQQTQFGHLPLYDHLPFNSVQRRNLAYLYCLQQGITADDLLITIDDDNFLKHPDYIGQHQANSHLTATTVTAEQPTWYNPLTKFYAEHIVPRGFSIFHRYTDNPVSSSQRSIPIAISAGLWEKNPDVDAVTNLVGLPGPCLVNRTEPLVVAKNILCPFNTQNTAYFANFWHTAFLSPYLGRYDDILSSYITKRIADHLGFGVSFGQPIVTQDRNPHDYYQDLAQEVHGFAFLDSFVSHLYTTTLSSQSILDCYQQLADAIHAAYPDNNFTTELHDLRQPWSLTKMTEGMKLWLATLDQLNVTASQPATTQQHA